MKDSCNMSTKTYEPVSIRLKMHGIEHVIDGLGWDSDSDTLMEAFQRLLVSAGFPPSVMNDEFGHWEYNEYDEHPANKPPMAF